MRTRDHIPTHPSGRGLVVALFLALVLAGLATSAALSGGAPQASAVVAEDPLAEPPPASEARPRTRSRDASARRRVASSVQAESPAAGDAAKPRREPIRLESVFVGVDDVVTLSPGDVHVSGDVIVEGVLHAPATVLILDGGNQSLSGAVTASRVVMRGGTKRLTGDFGTHARDPAKPGDAQLVVEAGTTLLIQDEGRWRTANPYGFQIAGDLVIDGGVFECRFSHGDGIGVGADSWLPGSSLTIHSGRFVGRGDASFDGATVTIYDGVLEIDDDIWSTGAALNLYGGLMRNAKRGGMFRLTGSVSMQSGELRVHQTALRGLQIPESTQIASSGGVVSIGGAHASHADGGILLGRSVVLHDLSIDTQTKVSAASEPSAFLSVTGALRVAKGAVLDLRGHPLFGELGESENAGRLVR